jgi:NAD+ synthase (glutamine-hydrolysing)
MNIAMGQFNPTIGDLSANAAAIERLARDAHLDGADLLLLPELCVLGYPPRDLLLREDVVPACEAMVERLAAGLPLPTLIGSPRRVEGGSRPIANSMALCRGGGIEAWHDKILLPTYDVFDENRWFQSGTTPLTFDLNGTTFGVLICEDLWQAHDVDVSRPYSRNPVSMAVDAKCEVLLVPSASPFVAGKYERHVSLLRGIAKECGVHVVMANQVGANDDLVFDGGSAAYLPSGAMLQALPRFTEGLLTVDLNGQSRTVEPMGAEEERFHAIVLALRDYCVKTRQPRVLLGASGGIDSAIVAALAVAALGATNVEVVLMPSRYSSDGSLVDARETARCLGISSAHELSIESLHSAAEATLGTGVLQGLADENVQARIRGLLLMARSNATGRMLLATSNKSELAVGYSTLYGDMNGGMMPIGDLYKTEVFALARWMNEHYARLGFEAPPIPEASITKPPSAELRPDQLDEDSLPPYDVLDAILRLRIDEECSPKTIAQTLGIEESLVQSIDSMHARSEFKRYQAALIPKLSPRTFGRGRQLPLASRWVASS